MEKSCKVLIDNGKLEPILINDDIEGCITYLKSLRDENTDLFNELKNVISALEIQASLRFQCNQI